LTGFIYVYYQLLSGKLTSFIDDPADVTLLEVVILGVVMAYLTAVHVIAVRRLRKYRVQAGLGNKLDRFYEIVLLRMSGNAVSSLLLALGLLLTASMSFGITFILLLGWILFQWPTSAKVCRDLALKGDEREMVFYKKDSF
jgi:hypothetical protein